MGVFTSLVTETVEILGGDGATAVIRKLAPKHLREARAVVQKASQQSLRDMGGLQWLKEIEALGTQAVAEGVQQVQADPLALYDWATVMQHGIVSWTLDAKRTGEVFEDMEEPTQRALTEAILRLAQPELFEANAEDALKNG